MSGPRRDAPGGGAPAGPTWRSAAPPPVLPLTAAGWLRAVLRGLGLLVVVYGGLALLLALRLAEAPLCGLRRPVTPHVTRAVCRIAVALIGLRLETRGTPMRGRGAAVANHAGWLDIFTLNATQTIYFVSKSEVAGWPGIGWLARATGTVFISRRGREAKVQRDQFEARLRAGHHLLFFPEGTSSDGMQVLPFKSTLFDAFFSDGLRDVLHVQPIALRYLTPAGTDARAYGWWGDMGFGPHLLRVLALPRRGRAVVTFGAPLRVADFPSRKALAAACEAAVRAGFDGAGGRPGGGG